MNKRKNPVALLPMGARWPSGTYKNIALLDVSSNDVARCFDAQLVAGHEDGLGAWKAIGGELKSGAQIELIEYSESPIKGFELRVDSAWNSSDVLSEALELLEAGMASVLWRSFEA